MTKISGQPAKRPQRTTEQVVERRSNAGERRGKRVSTDAVPRAELDAANTQTQLAAAIIELTSSVLQAESVTAAAEETASLLNTYFDCRAVAVSRVIGTGPRCKLLCQSGLSEIRRDSDAAVALETAMSEAAVASQVVHVWTRGAASHGNAPGHDPLAAQWNANVIVSAVMTSRRADDGLTSAESITPETPALEASTLVFTVIDPPPHRVQEVARFLDGAAKPLGTAVEALREARGRWTSRLRRRLRDQGVLLRLAVATVLLGVVVGALGIPVPYRMAATVAAEPVVRRYVVAPHKGLVQRGLVEPGDIVQADDTLAEMDGRDVRWELAGLEAKVAQATKQRDAALAIGDVPGAQSAELDVRSYEAQRQIFERRASELRLAAPIEGVVLDASLEVGSSLPVKTGETLYEVGSISPLRVEAALPADLWPHVAVGQIVEIQFDGHTQERFEATVEKIHPQVEIRDGQSAIVIETQLPNAAGQLRPGMIGTARIVGDSRPFAWTLFHRAAESAYRWLWW